MNYWKEFLPFYFYTIVAAILTIRARLIGAYSVTKIAVLIVLGIVSWMFIEYFLHRFCFHYQASSPFMKKVVYYMHLAHHESPKKLDQLFAGLTTSVPLATLYALSTYFITGSWQSMSYLFVGLILGYFAYELIHYQSHHHKPKLAVLRYLKKYHLLHHHQSPNLHFGVTSPFIDYLFGTY